MFERFSVFFCWNMLKMAHFAARHKAQTFGWWMSRISLPCESYQNPTPAPKGTHLTTLWKVTFLLTPYPVIHDSCRKLSLKHLGFRVTHWRLHMVIVGQLMLFQYLPINEWVFCWFRMKEGTKRYMVLLPIECLYDLHGTKPTFYQNCKKSQWLYGCFATSL